MADSKQSNQPPAPEPRLFERGVLRCDQCSNEAPFDKHDPLSMMLCPSCDRPHLVPMHAGPFWLFAPLGAGGMGAAYKACHVEQSDKLFCVKVLPREKREDPHLISILTAEAQASEAVAGHPCVVHFAGFGEDHGEHYLATELIPGERLDLRVERMGRLPANEVMLIALRLLAAEAHVYNCGYLYRDLKPENVMLSDPDGAVLYDFGLAMTLDEAAELKSDYVDGTAAYVPPERLEGKGEQVSSEIYSLGLVLYYTAVGRPYIDPHLSVDDLRAILRRHLSAMRQDAELSEIADPDLSRIIEKMIERHPHHRYQTFADIEVEIVAALHRRFDASPFGRLF